MTKSTLRERLKNFNWSDKIFEALVRLISLIIFIIIVYPLWFVVVASISNSSMVLRGEVTFWPKDISFSGFTRILQDTRIWTGYGNTIFYTVVGTMLNLAVTMPAAYALSRRNFKARNKVMLYFVITMYFSGGLIPTYMTVSSLGLTGTRAILLILGAVNIYNLIVARTFIQNSIPEELYEASLLDGCTHFKYFIKVVVPLSKAIIAVLILYYGVGHWNDYYNALIYNSTKEHVPLQIVLRDILLLNQAFEEGIGMAGGYDTAYTEQVKYAVMIVSTLPILCLYPFLQRYFEKGVMIGSIKG